MLYLLILIYCFTDANFFRMRFLLGNVLLFYSVGLGISAGLGGKILFYVDGQKKFFILGFLPKRLAHISSKSRPLQIEKKSENPYTFYHDSILVKLHYLLQSTVPVAGWNMGPTATNTLKTGLIGVRLKHSVR